MAKEEKRLKIGKKMKFIANDINNERVKLSKYKGPKVISMVPQLNTRICDKQTRKVSDWSDKYKDVVFISITVDSPEIAREWCGINDNKNSRILSDDKYKDFGIKYGLYDEAGLVKRGFIILNEHNAIVDYDIVVNDDPIDGVKQPSKEANYSFVQSFLNSLSK